MRDERLEPVGMAEDPVDHVTAVGAAGGADACAVAEWLGTHGVDAIHDVDDRLPAPVARYALDEGLSAARRAAGVRQQDDIAAGCEHLRVPAIAPGVAPLPLRASVNEHDERIFLCRVETDRFDHQPLNLRVLRSGPPELGR